LIGVDGFSVMKSGASCSQQPRNQNQAQNFHCHSPLKWSGETKSCIPHWPLVCRDYCLLTQAKCFKFLNNNLPAACQEIPGFSCDRARYSLSRITFRQGLQFTEIKNMTSRKKRD
jgi:hypothetical protein